MATTALLTPFPPDCLALPSDAACQCEQFWRFRVLGMARFATLFLLKLGWLS